MQFGSPITTVFADSYPSRFHAISRTRIRLNEIRLDCFLQILFNQQLTGLLEEVCVMLDSRIIIVDGMPGYWQVDGFTVHPSAIARYEPTFTLVS